MRIIKSQGELPQEFANAVLSENWQEAYEIVLPLAKQGNASAEHTIGWFHQQGQEVPQSDKEAFAWWSISAPKGIAESQAGLGSLYLSGRGTEANYQKAYYWLSLAVKNGEAHATTEAQQAKKKLTLWQYLYIKLLLLVKT